ncbi:MAG: hypothetical protein LBP67_06325 [Bacteroidales bacterium]|jgi:REP element-mobilizing transposase RayT|nr:hypothetical protein [Bacteroidales bacterium]
MKNKRKWKDYYVSLLKGLCYHIYNEGNNKQIIFRDDADKERFIKKFKLYMTPFVILESYSLMPNHFHIIMIVKKDFKNYTDRYINLDKVITRFKKKSSREEESIIIGELMRRFLMSYSKYYNSKYSLTGSLFRKNYRRILLETIEDIKRVIIFIHRNPQIHELINDFRDYTWSTYKRYKDETKWLLSSGVIFKTLFKNILIMEFEHINHTDNDYDIQIE